VAAEVYTGSVSNQTSFPLGHQILMFIGSNRDRNASVTPCINTSDTSSYIIAGAGNSGAALSGVWRVRGGIVDSNNDFYLAQRVA